jgi:hypothetical protein
MFLNPDRDVNLRFFFYLVRRLFLAKTNEPGENLTEQQAGKRVSPKTL